jgi:glucan phosphoethanolaminetransferase (alkaline phosphatase superfamily)
MGIKLIKEIRDWPPKRKQNLSLLLAFFLTIIIFFTSILIKEYFFEKEIKIESQYSPINRMSDSFIEVFEEAGEEANKIFYEAGERLDQIISTSSSSSIETNIVE